MNEQDLIFETLKATPPAAYVGITLGGIPLPDVVNILAGIYLIVQLSLVAPVAYGKLKARYIKWKSARNS